MLILCASVGQTEGIGAPQHGRETVQVGTGADSSSLSSSAGRGAAFAGAPGPFPSCSVSAESKALISPSCKAVRI